MENGKTMLLYMIPSPSVAVFAFKREVYRFKRNIQEDIDKHRPLSNALNLYIYIYIYIFIYSPPKKKLWKNYGKNM